MLKHSLANLAKRGTGQLTTLLEIRLKRLQCWPGSLDGFHASNGLDFAPWRAGCCRRRS